MKNILYHGSIDIIEKPNFEFNNYYNDFGKGFYLTSELEDSNLWAINNFNENGYSNEYELDFTNLKVLDLTNSKYDILSWITILLKNRTFNINNINFSLFKEYLLDNYDLDLSKYDVIKGYSLDNSIFIIINDFLKGSISINQLNKVLEYKKLKIQYVLKSKKAFESLTFKRFYVSDANVYYVKKLTKDEELRKYYFKTLRMNKITKEDKFIFDFIKK